MKYASAPFLVMVSMTSAFFCEFVLWALLYRTSHYQNLIGSMSRTCKKGETPKFPLSRVAKLSVAPHLKFYMLLDSWLQRSFPLGWCGIFSSTNTTWSRPSNCASFIPLGLGLESGIISMQVRLNFEDGSFRFHFWLCTFEADAMRTSKNNIELRTVNWRYRTPTNIILLLARMFIIWMPRRLIFVSVT